MPRHAKHYNHRKDACHHDRPQVVQNDMVRVDQPHAVGHEKERHAPQQEASGRPHGLGFHPSQRERCKEQDHADDVARDIASGEAAQRIARQPAQQYAKHSAHNGCKGKQTIGRMKLSGRKKRRPDDFSVGPPLHSDFRWEAYRLGVVHFLSSEQTI